MGRKTVELRAVVRLKDGSEIIQTGIYVFEDAFVFAVIFNLPSVFVMA